MATGLASLHLKIVPRPVPIPAEQRRGGDQVQHRVRCQVRRPHRAARRAARQPCKPGAVLRSRNVTVEVNTVFENLQSVVQAVDPAKLNSVLSAVAGIGAAARATASVQRHHRRQQRAARREPADADGAAGLAAVRPDRCRRIRMPRRTSCRSWTRSPPPARTITTPRQGTGRRCSLSAVGFSRSGIDMIGGNQPNLVRAMNLLDPTTGPAAQVLADLHLPVPGCAMVPGTRRPGCAGRQRQIGDHGRRRC